VTCEELSDQVLGRNAVTTLGRDAVAPQRSSSLPAVPKGRDGFALESAGSQRPPTFNKRISEWWALTKRGPINDSEHPLRFDQLQCVGKLRSELMALIKCRECGGSVSTEAAACPHCGAPQRTVPPPSPQRPVIQQQPRQKKGMGLGGCLMVLIAIGTVSWFITRYSQEFGKTPAPSEQSGSSPAATRPRDDVDVFIAKYGPPDREETTEHDSPRPPIVSRFLIYEAERVRAAYVPDGKAGDPPPYKWKLVGFQDSQDNSVLKPAEAVERLKNRNRP
jgi:hypothetical protein